MKKVYVDEHNQITLTCPRCGTAREIDISRYAKSDGPLKLSYKFKCKVCNCGSIDCLDCDESNCTSKGKNTVVIERRKSARKQVSLPGSMVAAGKKKHPVRILDISRKGLRFDIKTAHNVVVGNTISVEFNLDDAKRSLIEKKIVVRKVSDSSIEGEFTGSDEFDGSNKALGFYLL